MPRRLTALALVAAALLAVTGTAQARWLGGFHPQSNSTTYVKKNLWHARTTLVWLKHHKQFGTHASRARVARDARYVERWAEKRLGVIEAPQVGYNYWVARQIRVATLIGQASGGDPWPNCPDPFDGSGSWQDTVNCENGGNWYDSPGYYRCGLQFDPAWETKYGRLCP